MISVPFKVVDIGHFFKESFDGPWHLKVSKSTGEYRRSGVYCEPYFNPEEMVLVESGQFSDRG